MLMKSTQPNLTIVSVTGYQPYAQCSVYAIERSFQELRPQIADLRCILVSPEKPAYCPDFITHIPCKPFSYLEYNLFILYQLDSIIHTDFCLVVQPDGWVLNGENWQDSFFDYDYLGAPTPYAYQLLENGEFKHLEHQWGTYRNSINNTIFNCQNGGFSLRSKALLGMPRKLNLEWKVNPPKWNVSQPLSLELDSRHNEDVFLSVLHCKTLMNAGLKFVNDDVAAHFSMEYFYINETLNVPVNKVFGAHWLNMAVIVGANTVSIQAPYKYWEDATLFDTPQSKVIRLFADLNYDIQLQP